MKKIGFSTVCAVILLISIPLMAKLDSKKEALISQIKWNDTSAFVSFHQSSGVMHSAI